MTPTPSTKFIRSESSGTVKTAGDTSSIKSLIKSAVRRHVDEDCRLVASYIHCTATHDHADADVNMMYETASLSHACCGYRSAMAITRNASLMSERCTIMANSSAVVKLIENLVDNFKIKIRNKAYLHWYQKFGIEEDFMMDALEDVQCIRDAYFQVSREIVHKG